MCHAFTSLLLFFCISLFTCSAHIILCSTCTCLTKMKPVKKFVVYYIGHYFIRINSIIILSLLLHFTRKLSKLTADFIVLSLQSALLPHVYY